MNLSSLRAAASIPVLPPGIQTLAASGVPVPAGQVEWFCVKSQPKHEHIAAAHLQRECKLDSFLPRISFKRSTRSGSVRVTEALFPGYLFARFDLYEHLRQVQHARGVRGVVHFGLRYPAIPAEVVAELRAMLGADPVRVLEPEFEPGDRVKITGGSFHGLEAVVARAMPGRERVGVLLEFLGRQSMVEVNRSALLPAADARQALL